MSCTICNMFQGRWPIGGRGNDQDGQSNRSHFVPNVSWNALIQSATTCYCCEILVEGSKDCFDEHEIAIDSIESCSLRFYYPQHLEDADEADCDKHLVFHLPDKKKFEIEIFATEDEDCNIPETWDYFPTLKRTSPSTDSEEALETMREWISDCQDDHADSLCHSSSIPTLPTRVVDVGHDDSSVRLVETHGKKSQYICLSHCWGPTQIITTVAANLEAHKRQIPWKELSKTFQQAVTLTRTLGYQYIWIDSLCIIQDSARDWEIESAKMADIYSFGFLTIAATRSPNGAGGLFSPTPDVEVSGQTPEGEDYCLYFRERIDHHLDAGFDTAGLTPTERHYPLLTRAWVYQERMLSTRVLHFGHYELFFECKSSITCECDGIALQGSHASGADQPAALVKIEYADMLDELAAARTPDGKALAATHDQAARLWRTLVACYTALRLTMSKDRLPAISGIARQLGAGRKTRYLAGLWEDSLQDDLVWLVYAHSTFLRPRPHPRNAPTWSWASIETFVWYWDVIDFSAVDERIDSVRPPGKHLSEVQECQVVRSTVDDYGMVGSANLTISGLLVEGILAREMGEYEGREIVLHYISFQGLGQRIKLMADYLLDSEGPYQILPGSTVSCLRMSLLQEGQKEYLIVLVLKPSASIPGCFERIGTLRIAGKKGESDRTDDIFDSAKTETVVIV